MSTIATGGGEYPPFISVRETTGKPRILIVEDEPTVADVTRALLERRGYAVVTAMDGLEALEAIRTSEFACIVLDLRMTVFDGEQLLDLIAFDHPAALQSIIVVSGYKERAEKLRGRVREVFVKPVVLGVLEAAVGRCISSVAGSPERPNLSVELGATT